MKECLTQLLVHVDATAHTSQRLAVARAIAQGQGAALTALYAVTPALVEIPFAPDAGPNVAQVLCELDDERRANVRAGFDRANLEGLHAAWAEVRLPRHAGFRSPGTLCRPAGIGPARWVRSGGNRRAGRLRRERAGRKR